MASASCARGLSSDFRSRVSPGSMSFRRKPSPSVTRNGLASLRAFLKISFISFLPCHRPRIAFAVGLVVLFVARDDFVEREDVVTDHDSSRSSSDIFVHIIFLRDGQENTKDSLSFPGFHIQFSAHAFDQADGNVEPSAPAITVEQPLLIFLRDSTGVDDLCHPP